MNKLEYLYDKRNNYYSDGDYEQVERYDLLIASIEKAERMKDIKISKYRDGHDSRPGYNPERTDIRVL